MNETKKLDAPSGVGVNALVSGKSEPITDTRFLHALTSIVIEILANPPENMMMRYDKIPYTHHRHFIEALRLLEENMKPRHYELLMDLLRENEQKYNHKILI